MNFVLEYLPANSQEWVRLDLGDERPAITYQGLKIGDLQNRYSSYSMAISLPKTRNNIQALGLLSVPDVIAEAAYTAQPCVLLLDGAEVSPPKSVLVIDSIELHPGGYIQTAILSGVKDVFQLLENEQSQLYNAKWRNIPWNTERVEEDNTRKNWPIRWPFVSSVKGEKTETFEPIINYYNTIQVFKLVPCYHLLTFIKELFGLYGYDIESDLLGDEFAEQLYVTASDINNRAVNILDFTGSLSLSQASTGFIENYVFSNTGNMELATHGTGVYDGEIISGAANGFYFYPPQGGDYIFRLTITNTSNVLINDGRYKLRAHIAYKTDNTSASTTTVHTFPAWEIAAGESVTVNFPEEQPFVRLNYGGYIFFWIEAQSADLPLTATVSGRIMPSDESSDVGVGSRINIDQSLGFKNHATFVKAFLQLFCASIQVKKLAPINQNGARGIISIYSLGEVYRRLKQGVFVDWTHKIIPNTPQMNTFAIDGYAQRNIISFKENEDDNAADSAAVVANNKSLEEEKELFLMKFEAGRVLPWPQLTSATITATGATLLGLEFPSVPVLELTDSSNTQQRDQGTWIKLPEYKGCDAHLLLISEDEQDGSVILTFKDGTGAAQYTGQGELLHIPTAKCPIMEQFKERYYTPVEKMLTNSRVVTARFLLTALDIANLDLMTPVYLDMYGAYFYINKINNFGAELTTEVELIKL